MNIVPLIMAVWLALLTDTRAIHIRIAIALLVLLSYVTGDPTHASN